MKRYSSKGLAHAGHQRALSILLSLFLPLLASVPTRAATQLASTADRISATGAGNSYAPVFSADGRHVAFVSHANNLVTNDDLGSHLDLFVRDLVASNTVLVSVSTNGFGGANDNIGLYTLSSNAQVVAFDTAANNLVAWDNDRVSDVYVRNLEFGGMTRVSVGVDGDANGPSLNPLISEDGRYVIFESLASNLVTNDFNGTNDIFIHDLTTGVTELVSLNADGTASPDGASFSPSISANGLLVAFISHATNLVENLVHARTEVYARDVARRTNLRAAADININSTNGTYRLFPYSPNSLVVSKSGRYASFQTPGQFIRYDFQRPTNFVTSHSNATPPAVALVYYGFADNPRLVSGAVGTSPGGFVVGNDGRFMVHETRGNWLLQRGLVHTDLETLRSITFEIDHWGCCGLVTKTIPLMGVVLSNSLSNPHTWSNMNLLKITDDGSRVYYLRDSPSTTNGQLVWTANFYALDTSNRNERLLLSRKDAGRDLGTGSFFPAITEDGNYVAWDSAADTLVSDDLNRAYDVFVRNVDTGETQLISARHPDLPASSGLALSRLDLNPGAISGNGQRIAVLSLDSTLAPDDTNHWRDLFVRDLVTGTNIDVSRSIGRVGFLSQTNFPGTNTAAAPSLSANGRFIAFSGETLSLGISTNRTIYWRDLTSLSNRIVATTKANNPADVSHPVLSADGRFVAFSTSERLELNGDVNNLSDIYLHIANFTPAHHVWRNPIAVSVTNNVIRITGNGASINPVFSPDSTWLVFQSTATDLTADPDTAPGRYQLFARQFLTDQTNLAGGLARLISYTTTASSNLDGRSLELPLAGGAANPRFSADSRYVAFESATNLIYRHDLLSGFVSTFTEQDGVLHTNLARLTNALVCTNCANPSLSSEGRYVAYESRPAVGGITNIFVKNIETGQSDLVSVNQTGGAGGNGSSFTPLLSYDARFVVFASKASDLVPGDNNRATDIFVRDRLNGVTHCLSCNWSGTGTGNRLSSNPILSADGRTVAFQSFASDLVHGDYNDTRDVFVVTLAGPDSEGDGMDDNWEMAYFSTLARDGSGDFDGDGASDLDEFRSGTNPANNNSILRVLRLTTSAMPSPGLMRTTVLLWSASPGKTYRVQFKEDINAPWADLPGDITAGGTSASTTHTAAAPASVGFYRVLLVQ